MVERWFSYFWLSKSDQNYYHLIIHILYFLQLKQNNRHIFFFFYLDLTCSRVTTSRRFTSNHSKWDLYPDRRGERKCLSRKLLMFYQNKIFFFSESQSWFLTGCLSFKLPRGSFIYYIRKNFQKLTFLTPTRTCAYQRVRNVNVLNEWSLGQS